MMNLPNYNNSDTTDEHHLYPSIPDAIGNIDRGLDIVRMKFKPMYFSIKLNLTDELNIKILSKLCSLISLIKLNILPKPLFLILFLLSFSLIDKRIMPKDPASTS